MRLGLLPTLALLLAVSLAGAQSLPGPFVLNTGLTFYLVNPEGVAFDLTVQHRDQVKGNVERPTLVRVFDPAEKLLHRQELPGPPTQTVLEEELKLSIPASGKGIYQVIVTGWHSVYFAHNTISLTTEPQLAFGVHGHLQELCGLKEQFADTYIYLPPGLRELPVTTSGPGFAELTLLDESGAEKLKLDKATPKDKVALPAGGERVWRLQAQGSYYGLNFNGLPIILCPSPEVARAIKASVDIMPDGTLCFHKHQIAAWQLLQQYKRRPASDYAVEVRPLAPLTEAFLKQPDRHQLLFGPYGSYAHLAPALANQCLDPASPWFGSIHVWQDEQGQPRTDNPFTDYNRLGLEQFAALSKNLAVLYWLKDEINPYYRDPQLLNRLSIAVLIDQLAMKEGEYCSPDNTYYWGIHAFTLSHNHSGAFSLIYKEMPAAVQAIWLAGQQRLTDRFIYGTVGGCTNQWAVLVAALWRFYEGTGWPEYRALALRNLEWLMNGRSGTGQLAAGYMTEAGGPDATYNGITTHYLAEFYHASKDPAILESLRQCFHFFNHTVAPEPEGKWLGSSGYCHRTPGDWSSPQYGAGLGVMAKHLPEAGVRYPNSPPWAHTPPVTDAASRTAAEEMMRRVLSYYPDDFYRREKANTSRGSGAFDIAFANWRYYSDKALPGVLPCQEKDSFTRNFGDEFFCVKRPGYYAFLYGGVRFGLWQSGTRPKVYNHQFPHNDGLALVWSPQFGSSLLTKNWGAAQANTLLAELADGRIEWPWYWDTKSSFDTEAATATLTGRLNETKLTYERVYRFAEDHISCTLTLKSEEPLTLKRLSECLPFPLKDIKALEVKLLDAAGQPAAAGAPVQGFYFTNDSGQGHLVVLEQPLAVDVGQDHSKDHYGGEHDYGRVLIALPTRWIVGQEYRMTYRIIPCAATEVAHKMK